MSVKTQVYLRAVLENDSIQSCADVIPWCTSVTFMPSLRGDNGKGFWARKICPATCGCSDAMSDLFISLGCSQSCRTLINPAYNQSLYKISGQCMVGHQMD